MRGKFREQKIRRSRERGKKEIERERKKNNAIMGRRREVKRKNAIEIEIKKKTRRIAVIKKRRLQANGKKVLRIKKIRDDVREREDRNSEIQTRERRRKREAGWRLEKF